MVVLRGVCVCVWCACVFWARASRKADRPTLLGRSMGTREPERLPASTVSDHRSSTPAAAPAVPRSPVRRSSFTTTPFGSRGMRSKTDRRALAFMLRRDGHRTAGRARAVHRQLDLGSLAPSLLLRPLLFSRYDSHDAHDTRHTQWTTDQDLEDVCSQFGKVKQVKFFENKQNGRSKGYALVEYYDAEASRQAKEKLQG